MEKVVVKHRVPSVEEYLNLRKAVGWTIMSEEAASQGLSRSLFAVCIKIEGKAVTMGRVIGDGGTAFYIHDIIVLPQYQKNGFGKTIASLNRLSLIRELT